MFFHCVLSTFDGQVSHSQRIPPLRVSRLVARHLSWMYKPLYVWFIMPCAELRMADEKRVPEYTDVLRLCSLKFGAWNRSKKITLGRWQPAGPGPPGSPGADTHFAPLTPSLPRKAPRFGKSASNG